MNLYEIDANMMAAFEAAIDQETGEVLDEEALDAFQNLQMEWDAKVENIACYVKNLKAEAAALKAEKDSLAARQKVAERKAERLTRYLSGYLNGTKFDSPKAKITWRKSEAVQVDDVTLLPEEYLVYAAPTVNKVDIKAALKSGKDVPGAQLIQNMNMSIK